VTGLFGVHRLRKSLKKRRRLKLRKRKSPRKVRIQRIRRQAKMKMMNQKR